MKLIDNRDIADDRFRYIEDMLADIDHGLSVPSNLLGGIFRELLWFDDEYDFILDNGDIIVCDKG